MTDVCAGQLPQGSKVVLDNEPCNVIENEFVKPGKGQAFNRIKLRYLISNKLVEKTFRAADTLTLADVVEKNMQYVYSDSGFWYFMDPSTFEQMPVAEKDVGEAINWLKEGLDYHILIYNSNIIAVTPPKTINLKVTETEPAIKGNTVTGAVKAAKTETGAVIQVPLFVEVDEYIKIDTKNFRYLSRVKE